ncbi:hypothetical protein B566_EDAN007906 [Ephemera danica]|nr:hypothetical protein B566_EDAN007906 [Ephemera danica]
MTTVFTSTKMASVSMWQGGGMGGGHGQNNPWLKLMGIVHKERRHHEGSGTSGQTREGGTSTTASNDRTLNQ